MSRFLLSNAFHLVALAILGCPIGCAARAAPPPSLSAPQACVPSESKLSPLQIESSLRPNIVQINSDDSLGTGFFLHTPDRDDVLIVTNYHVIAEGQQFKVIFRRSDGKHVTVSNVEVVKTSPEDDLALLKAPRMQAYGNGLELTEQASTGESIVTLGFPVLRGAEAAPTLSNGLVTSTDHKFNDHRYILTDLKLVPGNSGGPAVDSCGRVAGVTSAFHAEATHVGLLVPSSKVSELYRAYSVSRPPEQKEIRSRLSRFMRLIEHEQRGRASAYFSREFYRQNVFPVFKDSAQEALAKREKLKSILEYLERTRGVDISSLTVDQITFIQQQAGIEFTPAELHAVRIIKQAQEQRWDAYTTLQAYFAPLVDVFFGRVTSFAVEEIENQGEVRNVYLTLKDDSASTRYLRLSMVYEWGDWQISELEFPRVEASKRAVPERSSGTQIFDKRSEDDWVPVSNKPR